MRNATAAVKKLVAREDALRQKVKDARAKAATSTRASSKNALVRAREALLKGSAIQAGSAGTLCVMPRVRCVRRYRARERV